MAMTMRLYTDAGSRREAEERPCCLCCASLAGACAYDSVHRSRSRRPEHSNRFRRRCCFGKHRAYAETSFQPLATHAADRQPRLWTFQLRSARGPQQALRLTAAWLHWRRCDYNA